MTDLSTLRREAEQRIKRLETLAGDPYAGGTERGDAILLRRLLATA